MGPHWYDLSTGPRLPTANRPPIPTSTPFSPYIRVMAKQPAIFWKNNSPPSVSMAISYPPTLTNAQTKPPAAIVQNISHHMAFITPNAKSLATSAVSTNLSSASTHDGHSPDFSLDIPAPSIPTNENEPFTLGKKQIVSPDWLQDSCPNDCSSGFDNSSGFDDFGFDDSSESTFAPSHGDGRWSRTSSIGSISPSWFAISKLVTSHPWSTQWQSSYALPN